MLTREKVFGMFAGIAIGDALGMPVECWKPEAIEKKFTFINDYVSPNGHKYFSGVQAGTTTDDTQLTLAVAEALIEAEDIDVDIIAKWHIKALADGTAGWGKSTRNAVRKLKSGILWPQSSESDLERSGVGNGVLMKVAPLGAIKATRIIPDFNQKMVEISSITHHSKMAAFSGIIHANVISSLLWDSHDRFSVKNLAETIIDSFQEKDLSTVGHLTNTEDDLLLKMKDICLEVQESDFYFPSTTKIIEIFGGGSPYVYHSMPFSYSFFLRNPYSLETLFDVVNAGGDADTNASIVGGMLGSLHGLKFFPKKLLQGVRNIDKIMDTAERFCSTLKIGTYKD